MNNQKPTRRHGLLSLIGFVLILAAICIGVSMVTSKWIIHSQQWKHDQPDGHEWLHKELGLTKEEAEAIDLFEADYRQRRGELLDEFNRRKTALVGLLKSTQTYPPEVTGIIHQLHQTHGELQQLSIKHYYDMLNALPPEKQGRLRDLAVKALSEPE